jgi:hypothetical protein
LTGTQKAVQLLIVLAVVAIAFILWLLMHRRATRLAASRWRDRTPVSDHEFLRGCEIPDEPLMIEVALAARRVIAELGTVPPETIRPNDTFTHDLVQLPFWDSLDWMDFIFRVERECLLKVSRPLFCEGAIDSFKAQDSDLQVRHVIRAVALSATQPPNEVPAR